MTRLELGVDNATGMPAWPESPARVGEWSVAADASLYYHDDLVRRFPAAAGSDDPATCIAHVLVAAGPEGLHSLEGDYACIAWHAADRRLIAARDFGGKRPLFYRWHGETLTFASSIGPLVSRSAIGLDLTTIATVAGGLWSHADATAYLGVRELLAGHLLEWQQGRAPTVRAFWQPPDRIATRRDDLAEAARELRELLDDAVRERCTAGATAVSLSGGWDSTAVFATAQAVGHHVHPVSISYPEGDPGREDELIEMVARHWEVEPDFIDVDAIPLYSDWETEASRRDSPFAHAYEHWNRALARRARERGATVVLDGVGGDQLFQCGDIYLADLVRTLQWGELAGQLRHRAAPGNRLRHLYSWGLRPNLPDGITHLIARARGLPPARNYMERIPPRWFRRDFLQSHGVLARESGARPPRTARSHVLAEAHAYLRFAFYPRMFAHLADFARQEGVELRSPLLDERVVRFAIARPWSDRIDGGETKRLLRLAMRERLPAEVLAPRTHRTGTTNAYFLRELRRAGWPVAQRVLPEMRMAALGMIEPSHYRRAWEHVLQHDDDELAARLFFTLQAELWLRTHLS